MVVNTFTAEHAENTESRDSDHGVNVNVNLQNDKSKELERMCDQEAKIEEYLDKLSSLKGYTEGFSDTFTKQVDEFSRFMKQEQLEYLDDAYKGKVKRFCTNLVDVWIAEFLKG